MGKILVTGGTGFLGSALVKELVRKGHDVRILDNDSRGNVRKLGEFASQVELIQADIRDADAVADATKGVELVYHLAFVNGTRFFYEKPELVLDVGVRGALTTLDAGREAQCGPLCPGLVLRSLPNPRTSAYGRVRAHHAAPT